MVASGNKNVQLKQRGDNLSFPVKATTQIYRGSFATIELATGGLSYSLTKGNHFAGITEENVLGGSVLGDKICRVRRRGIVRVRMSRTVAEEIIAAVLTTTANGGASTVFSGDVDMSGILVGDYVTIAGCIGIGAPHNGEHLVEAMVVGTPDTMQVNSPFIAAYTPAGTETINVTGVPPSATDLGKVAALIAAQSATVEEKVAPIASGAADLVVIGTIVKLEALPSPYVWVDINPGAEAYQVPAT